jgi:uncharacterized protein involved in exopolysaccharide biosynthesis
MQIESARSPREVGALYAVRLWLRHWKWVIGAPLVGGALALGATYLMAPVFTARTSFLPPQPQQSAAMATLSQLGALAGLAGTAGVRTPADQYVSLLQSTTIADRLIDQFKLIQAYGAQYRFEAREELNKNVRIVAGRRDGIISLEVDDIDPQRAAGIANAYVEGLRRLTSELALTEAQQRRAFFERELTQTRHRLTAAQHALQASGFNAGALRAEPRAAAEGYARLRAEVTATEVRLQAARRGLADSAPEVQQLQSALATLRGQLAKTEGLAEVQVGVDYVGKYREYKYQETLFDLFSRQYELARLDESREGATIQVIDVATKPEYKSRPKRAAMAAAAALAAWMIALAGLVLRDRFMRRDPVGNGPAS